MRCVRNLSLLLLLLLLVGLGSTLQLLEDGYPIMWTKAPDNLSLHPRVDSVVIINPWNYLQRMSLYRMLMSATEPYMASMGLKDTDNPLWGLPLHLSWQYLSGRLVDPTGASECGTEKVDPMCISPLSWWGCMSYYTSVIPFMAAAEKGLIANGFKKVQVQIPDVAGEDYCISHADCTLKHPEVMAKWEDFFQALKDISKSDLSVAEKKDKILGYMWDAEHASRHIEAPAKCQKKEVYYSRVEMAFAESYIHLTKFLAITKLNSNIDNGVILMSPLPSRVLQDTDVAPYISDLSPEENQLLYIQGWSLQMDKLMGDEVFKLWASAMCSQEARERAQEALIDLLTNPDFNTSDIYTVVTELTLNCFPNLSPFSPFQTEHAEL